MYYLLPTLPSLEVKLILLANYIVCWYVLEALSQLVFKDRSFRFKLIDVLFYSVLSTGFAGILLMEHLQGQFELTTLHIHFLLSTVAFYLFSTLEALRSDQATNWPLVLHHVGFGTILMWYAMLANFPSTYLWMVAVQFTSMFPAFKSLLKRHSPIHFQRYRASLEEADFWCFLCFRIFLQTGVMLYGMYEMYHWGLMHVLIPIGFLLAMYLNIAWFTKIIARRR
ncbi:MAG: hypothetical protein AAFV80_09760, partial [Bacteroidota bacterium]